MRIRMDIQPGRRSIPSLANWLAGENARFYALHPTLPGVREAGLGASGDLWHWHDARLLLVERQTSPFAWAAARAAELLARGSGALKAGDAAWGKARARTIGARVVLRRAPGHDPETGAERWWIAIHYRIAGRLYRESPEASSVVLDGPIYLHLVFGEKRSVRLLNWLAAWNAEILRQMPRLPGLYQSGVRYERESEETWSDYLYLLLQRWEDCDALAAARAGELIARGWKALRPGDGGYAQARRRKPESLEARVFMRTRLKPGKPGLYHCLVKYRLGSSEKWFYDDPSARLGMLDRRLGAQEVQDRLYLQKYGPKRHSSESTRNT